MPTFKNPDIACRPPMMPKSTPYWNGHMLTRVHAAMHFQWALRLSGFEVAMVHSFPAIAGSKVKYQVRLKVI